MKPTKSKDQQQKDAIAIYRNEAFDIGFYDYFKDISINKISQVLNSRERNVKMESITYRQLNSWDKEGLLTTKREGNEWRKFSIMDAIWVRIIKELREFGMSWEQIKTTKKCFEFESKKCGVQMPILEFYTAFAIGGKMPVLLLVFKDGAATPANFTQYKVAREFLGIENHLQINLNEILQSFFPKVDLKPSHKSEMPVNFDEMELLAFLRVTNYEKIEIRYKNGKIDIIEGMERLKATKRIHDILNEQKYATIEIIQQDGKVVEYVRKTKTKISR